MTLHWLAVFLLVAAPALSDPNFGQAVVLLCGAWT